MLTKSVDMPLSTYDDILAHAILALDAQVAAERLDAIAPTKAADFLATLSPAVSEDIIIAMTDERREQVISAAPSALAKQWALNLTFPEDSIGRLLEPPHAIFRKEMTAGECIERIRKLVKNVLVTYGFIVDPQGHLIGVVAMRDLLLAPREDRLADIMLPEPFYLRVDDSLLVAMRLVVNKHFPVYPVCDAEGRLVGTLRGRTLFEQHAFEISAQVGSLVGVEKEERLSTPFRRCLRFRHPWLQLNLLTAFLAAAVVGYFQSTIDQMVVLAVFLPVLAGQSGNTGCQSLAVTLRGLTLGEISNGRSRRLIAKEGLLGLANGALVGLVAAIAMWLLAVLQNNPHAGSLGVIVFVAMTVSCLISGISGAFIPLLLRKFGADPATASSIFLTTATDVVSMGALLGLASLFVI
jgi:magnesium transporter